MLQSTYSGQRKACEVPLKKSFGPGIHARGCLHEKLPAARWCEPHHYAKHGCTLELVQERWCELATDSSLEEVKSLRSPNGFAITLFRCLSQWRWTVHVCDILISMQICDQIIGCTHMCVHCSSEGDLGSYQSCFCMLVARKEKKLLFVVAAMRDWDSKEGSLVQIPWQCFCRNGRLV